MSDLLNAEIVARVTGRKPGDQRWTELSIYRVRGLGEGLGYRGEFLGEIVGETMIVGEERRVRRNGFSSVIDALAWGAFNQKTALYEELRRKATAWLEAQVRSAGMVPVSRIVAEPGQPPKVVNATKTIAERAIELLRVLVGAAKRDDYRAVTEACDEADEFLNWIDNAAD